LRGCSVVLCSGEFANPIRIGYSVADERHMHRGTGGEAVVLEERMKTMQAEYKTDIVRLAEDNAKRETRLIVTIAGLLAFAVAVLGLLIRWPG